MSDIKAIPNKSLGQNFLINESIVKLFVQNIKIVPSDILLEIGGGTGIISDKIINDYKYKHYYIYEIDPKLVTLLNEKYSKFENVSIVQKNILDSNLSSMPENIKVFGALPYYITSPIIHKFIEMNNNPYFMQFIVQKEVGNKILEIKPRSNYWTYATSGYDKFKLLDIKSENFYPIPKVDSTIICFNININRDKSIKEIGFKHWKGFLHLVYNNPRKMINKCFSKEILDKAGINGNLRPQDLSFEDIITLYNIKYDRT